MSNGKRKLRALGEFIAEESLSLKSEFGIHMFGRKEKKKTSHTHRASRVCAETVMAEVAGNPTWALSDPEVQAAVLRMPMKGAGARACCARPSVFLTTEEHMKSEHVKSVAGSRPRWHS